MNTVEMVKQFMRSDAYEQLTLEAEYNPNAMELLDIVSLSLESLVFFKSKNIHNRVQLETININKLFNFITEIYEQN
tara:strand:- start:1596 stop:1826 length:231 start_codon:yes stop_codon:yes gene_type:complete